MVRAAQEARVWVFGSGVGSERASVAGLPGDCHRQPVTGDQGCHGDRDSHREVGNTSDEFSADAESDGVIQAHHASTKGTTTDGHDPSTRVHQP